MRILKKSMGLAGLVALSFSIAKAQAPDAAATYQLEFLGKNFPDDWARVASSLVEKNVAPIASVTVQPGEGSCQAALRALKFGDHGIHCSASIQTLLDSMNRDLPNPIPLGATVKYPDLPVEALKWTALFDSSQPGEADRQKAVVGAWSQLKSGERKLGTQTQVEFNGFRTQIEIPNSTTEAAAVESVERFSPILKRSDIRALRLSDGPIAKSPFSNPQQQWYETCRAPPGATPPKPPFMDYLADGDSSNPPCVKACKPDQCPEIVLVDKQVAPHPDVAAAMGLTPNDNIPMCKHLPWQESFHATHLAGIMVGADNAKSFTGLAPASKLTSYDYEKSVAGGPGAAANALVTLINEKEQSRYKRSIIFVFASKFNNPQDTDPELSEPRLRRERPSFIPAILNSTDLWVVAAGQKNVAAGQKPAPGRNIDANTPDSPMNLGDTSNVIVVTACDDCLSDSVSIPLWANYSKSMVNVAAPGGSSADGIPGPATASEYSQAYGTSQATAMVGGLAAAMISCFPDSYKSGKILKIRIQATAKPIVATDVAQKVAAGIVNAANALLDPNFHWITIVNSPMRKATELQWCKSNVELKQPDSEDPVPDGLFSAKNIRQIFRYKSGDQTARWYFLREPSAQDAAYVFPTGPGTLMDDVPLLKVRYDDGTASEALHLQQIESLIVAITPSATTVKPCNQ